MRAAPGRNLADGALVAIDALRGRRAFRKNQREREGVEATVRRARVRRAWWRSGRRRRGPELVEQLDADALVAGEIQMMARKMTWGSMRRTKMSMRLASTKQSERRQEGSEGRSGLTGIDGGSGGRRCRNRAA